MTELTTKELFEWFEEQDEATLQAIADDLIERGFADPLSDEGATDGWPGDGSADIDEEALGEAGDRLRRHEYREALHHLVRALGRDFDALNDLPLAQA